MAFALAQVIAYFYKFNQNRGELIMWRYVLKNRKTGQIMTVEGTDLQQIQFNYRINISDWQIIKTDFIR